MAITSPSSPSFNTANGVAVGSAVALPPDVSGSVAVCACVPFPVCSASSAVTGATGVSGSTGTGVTLGSTGTFVAASCALRSPPDTVCVDGLPGSAMAITSATTSTRLMAPMPTQSVRGGRLVRNWYNLRNPS